MTIAPRRIVWEPQKLLSPPTTDLPIKPLTCIIQIPPAVVGTRHKTIQLGLNLEQHNQAQALQFLELQITCKFWA